MKNYNVKCPMCGLEFHVEYLQANIICESCSNLIGYHTDETLPKPGSLFILPKGVKYNSLLDGNHISKRKMKRRMHHVLNGVMFWHRETLWMEENPRVRWSGSGHYWCTADINDVEFL